MNTNGGKGATTNTILTLKNAPKLNQTARSACPEGRAVSGAAMVHGEASASSREAITAPVNTERQLVILKKLKTREKGWCRSITTNLWMSYRPWTHPERTKP